MDQLATLSEDARQLALGRFRMLQPHLENGVSLRLVAKDAGIPFRTAQRWVGLYREFGLSGLSRKNRGDKGEPRAVSALVREAIEGLALQSPPLPIGVICRQKRRLAEEAGEVPPSYWIALIGATLKQLELGLEILGIEVPERM